MIERIRFKNFKALKDAEIKLGPFNLIVGPNGSGKSTIFEALRAGTLNQKLRFERVVTAGTRETEPIIGIEIDFDQALGESDIDRVCFQWTGSQYKVLPLHKNRSPIANNQKTSFAGTNAVENLRSIRIYMLDPSKIAEAVMLQPNLELSPNGSNLAGVLDNIRDNDEEAFISLRGELRRWLPEYDNIVFETPSEGHRSIKLRRVVDKQLIGSADLSEGTLLALCLLTIAYNPSSPPLICLEEPDRALHPRLLRDVKDALYRLAFPSDFGLNRKPVQVIATTHSPYFLDLFKDHPEQVTLAEKHKDGTATFKNLADDPQMKEIIGDAPLGEVWYSGILGGVPVEK